jgi:hypothetical protein
MWGLTTRVNDGASGFRTDQSPGPKTFTRLASLVEIIREKLGTRHELIDVSETSFWPANPTGINSMGIKVASMNPSPMDVDRIAAMIAADIITRIDAPLGSRLTSMGIQIRIAIDHTGIEVTYRVMKLSDTGPDD